MASKRNIRRKACEGKQKMEKYSAIAYAKKLRKRGEIMNAYLCKFCGRWHIGHMPHRMKVMMEKKRSQ
jgi:hypothetical protein